MVEALVFEPDLFYTHWCTIPRLYHLHTFPQHFQSAPQYQYPLFSIRSAGGLCDADWLMNFNSI